MKKLAFICGLTSMLVASVPVYAQENNQQGDDPLNVVAPAATPAAEAPGWMQYNDPYATTNNLGSANRTSDEILAWGEKAVADSLSFTAGEFNQTIRTNKKYFLKDGWAEYGAYLKDSKLLGVAQSNKYYINTIVNGTPMIVNSGALNGIFRWVVSVPIITTVNQSNTSGEQKPISSSKLKIDLMISRVGKGGVDGVAVEKWRMNVSDDKNITK